MRVLITGAGGFIGSHLVESQLEQGHQVRAVDLQVGGLSRIDGQPNVEVIRGDITQSHLLPDWLEGVDVVFHLASAHLDVSLPDDRYWEVNVTATRELLQAAKEAGVQRFVHVSSVGVMGDVKNPPADESSPCRPTNIYETTKLAGERAALEFASREEFPVVVARPAWVYGPRCPRTSRLIRSITKGRFPVFGSGRNLRHPVYISDTIRGLEMCAQVEGVEGEIFIIAGKEAVQVIELIGTISAVVGVKAPSLRLPVALGQMAGVGFELVYKPLRRKPPFSKRSLDFFLKSNAYRIDKARERLGYQPQVELEVGMINTVLWQRSENNSSTRH